uniref:protein-serine/threonine phosphatase n=1 Tax=Acanthochromis polyacanthus TaxID=80966 RepID=A0A3Q1F3E9_9TELE
MHVSILLVCLFTPVCVSVSGTLIISESFLTVKGAALFLPRGNSPTPNSAPRISQRRNKHTGDLQKHLQTMFTVLRPEDTIRLAVRLECAYPQVTRYMVVVSTNGRQDTEESIVLGMDFVSSDSCCTVGLVLPLWSDTLIHLDGDGGFSVSTVNRVHVFKPVSVQAMWSSLQSLHKACEVARCHNYYPGSLFLTWVSYYQSRVSSNQFCINEWNAMQDVESHRANSPVLFTDLPTERERTERLIKMRLREIMMQKDLENVTSKEIRTELEMQMVCNLREFKEFIDNEMIVILGQMDSPTEIFEHVYLGSEWNASNLEELQNSGVRYILNVTREIDNFFPGMFEYHNIRVYDEEATNLLEYWNETYKFITKAKKAGAKCLVHCKMGVSRSASTVIAYAMKEYGWDLDTAFDYVKERRTVTKPNPSFMKQLEEYQGILLASKQRHNKLWRSHSDSDLSDRPELLCKPSPHSLGRSDSHNNNTSSPSLHHFLGVAVLQALGAEPEDAAKSNNTHTSDSQTPCNGVSACEDPLLFPLPTPRAATVFPEEKLDNSASVAVTVPVALPHPPPSLHILPPTPELHRAHRGAPPHLSVSTPKCKPVELSLNLSERSSSEEISPLTLGSSDSDIIDQSLSHLTSDKHTPLSSTCTTPLPLALPLVSSDDNNNPSELHIGSAFDSRGEADGSSNHSADSIDFFSAREKFVGLAQDGRTRTLSEQAQQRTAVLIDGETEANEEEEEEEQRNGTSQVINRSSSEVTHDSLTPPSHPPSPSMLPCDWPAGSVRRATKQLEQKLKQELEMTASQRSPLHSPSSEHPPVRLPLCSPSTEHPSLRSPQHSTEQRITQGENMAVSTNAKPKDSGRLPGSHTELQRLNNLPDPSCSPNSNISQVSGAIPVIVHTPTDSHMPQGLRDTMDTEPGLYKGVSVERTPPGLEVGQRLRERQEGRSFVEPTGWHRAMELEARIRQAGLTPPSLMKRSASLAKLDCLELSANDLSDLDLRPHSRTTSSLSQDSFSLSQSHPDDTWKKQKVLSQNSCVEKTGLFSDGTSSAPSLCPSSSTSSSSSTHGCPKDDTGEREEPDGSGGNLVSSARQQGRGHSSRRRKAEKKQRAVTVLYNTM